MSHVRPAISIVFLAMVSGGWMSAVNAGALPTSGPAVAPASQSLTPPPLSTPSPTPPPPAPPPLAKPLPMIARSTRSVRTGQAIDRAVKFLLSRQNRDGSWNDASNEEWTVGQTAIVTLALLSAGEDDQSPAITRAIDYLRTGKIADSYATYAVALRACVLAQLPEASKRPELRIDVQWLQKAMIDRDPNNGFYTYGMPHSAETADLSNSQYGVLGEWYAAEAGLEIPFSYWRRAENAWVKAQQRDGGWGYIPFADDGSYASMTAAGTATLFITNDYLHAREAYDLFRVPNNAALDRAIAWLGEHFAVDFNPGRDTPPNRQGDLLSAFTDPQRHVGGFNLPYMLFGYERVGEASGLTRFGSHRWFDAGADFLLASQFSDGSWSPDGSISGSPEVETSYALLFLSRGLSPIALQKLQFGTRWNNRSRDVADFTFFLRHNTETHYNWQITSLSASPAELREAPILYAASDRPFIATAAQADALKSYLLHGGLLVAANDGETSTFANSIEKLGVQLFPGYTFRDLPLRDTAYTGNFPTAGLIEPIRVLDNGVRKLIVLFPRGDLSWKFQSAGGSPKFRQSPYAPLANIWASTMGIGDPLVKGETTWIEKSAAQVDAPKKITLARLQFAGNWDPEPAGWQRMANLLHNSGEAELQIDAIRFDQLGPAYPIAHLTATGRIKLSAPEQAALEKYLDHGGLLFFDAAGGSPEAAASIQAILAGIYPAASNDPLPIDHPIYAGTYDGGGKIDAVTYRRNSDMPPTTLPRLRAITLNGKLLAIISDEDISSALVGYPASGFAGYSPQSAAELTRAILLWAFNPAH
jgi:hypothetical protein